MPLSHSGKAGQPTAGNLCTTRQPMPMRSGWGLCKSLCASLSLVVAALLASAPVLAQPALKTTTNKLGMTLVRIPAGSFVMGACKPDTPNCTRPDPNATDFEGPLRRVNVKAFWLGQTEVTQGQFKQFIMAMGRADLITEDFIKYNNVGDDAAITWVSWNDAQDFIAWLNRTQGGGHRLPSEAEWEYACRAGGNHTYCGSDDLGSVAWHGANSGDRVRIVASLQPNAWGLHDLSGNVWEWVEDPWHKNFVGAPTDGSAWTNGGAQTRVLRGGSWWEPSVRGYRVANRYADWPDKHDLGRGFRVARTAP